MRCKAMRVRPLHYAICGDMAWMHQVTQYDIRTLNALSAMAQNFFSHARTGFRRYDVW